MDGKTGFSVEPGDAGDLADKILRLLQDSELRMRMGQNCRALIQGHTAEYTASRLFGLATGASS